MAKEFTLESLTCPDFYLDSWFDVPAAGKIWLVTLPLFIETN
jgi:hypothetical protein